MTRPHEPPMPNDELDSFDIELDGAEESPSSIEISYDEREVTAVHDAFVDAREVARRAAVRSRPKIERLPLVGEDRETRIRRAELLRALSENARGGHRARLLLSTAELFETVGDPRAVRMLDNALAESPADPVALRARRRLASRAGRIQEAIADLRAELELPLGPIDRAFALALLADRLEAAGEPVGAVDAAREAHEAVPDSPATALLWVNTAARAGNAPETVRALVAAIQSVRSPSLRGLLALELAHRAELAEKADAALAWAEAALHSSPDLLAAHLVAIRASRKIGDAASVRSHVAALAARLPDGPARSALLRWTVRYARTGGERPDEVLKLLKLPTSSADFRLLAELALTAGDSDAARRHLARAADLGSSAQRAAALRDLAMLELRLGHRERAIEALREASRADPGSPLEARLRARLGDTRSDDDPLERAASCVPTRAIDAEIGALTEARDRGDAPLAAALVASDLVGFRGDRAALVDSLSLEHTRRPRAERPGLALAMAVLRLGEGDVRGALAALGTAGDDPIAARFAAELRGEPVESLAADSGETRHGRIRAFLERLLDAKRGAPSLHGLLELFGDEPALLTLARRLADTPAILDARRAALEGGKLPTLALAEAAILALGRGERGEMNPHARAVLERSDASELDRLLAARVVELSHAPAEAARIRAPLTVQGATLVGARLALRGGDAPLGEHLARAALASHPRSLAAARTLAVAGMEADSPESLALAGAALVDLLAPTEDGVVAARLLHHAARFTPSARPGLERATRAYVHHPDLLRALERTIRAMGGAPAAALLERIARSYATPIERASALVRAAEIAERGGALEDARRLLADAVTEDRRHPAAAEALARVEEARGDVRSAIDALVIAAEAARFSPRKAALLHHAARLAEASLSDDTLALALLTRALDVDPHRADTLEHAIALKRARGEEIPEAWLRSHASVDEAPASADLSMRKAEIHLSAGEPERALEVLEALLRESPGHAQALRACVDAELARGRPERAMEHAKALLEASTKDEDVLFAHITLGRLLDTHRGDLAASAAHYRMAVALAPRDGALRGRLATLKARLGDRSAGDDLRAALEDLGRAIERRPDRRDGWRALVETLAGCGFVAPAATVEGVAMALGTMPHRPLSHALGPLHPELVARVAPRTLTPATRVFFEAAAPILEGLAPFRLERWSATPLDPAHPVAKALAPLADEGLEVLVSARIPRACVPVDSTGRSILFGHELVERFDVDALRFLAASAQAIGVAKLAPVLQLNRQDLTRCLGAVFVALELDVPGYEAHREGPFVEAARRWIGTPDEVLGRAALALAQDPSFEVAALVDATTRLGHRAALGRVGDGKAALEALQTLYDVGAEDGRARVEATRAIPAAWDLVLFSMSPACIDLRRRAGASR